MKKSTSSTTVAKRRARREWQRVMTIGIDLSARLSLCCAIDDEGANALDQPCPWCGEVVWKTIATMLPRGTANQSESNDTGSIEPFTRAAAEAHRRALQANSPL